LSKLSARQQAILDFIKHEVRTKGYPPSVREIGEAVGLASSSTVHGHLDRLEKKGLIRRDATKPRAIEITDGSDDMTVIPQSIARVPLVGKVTAGVPILATENIEDYFPLPSHMVGDFDVFMLSVSGDSMIEAGIHDGDYVIVRKQSVAVIGDIVVAMTEDDEAKAKRFYKEKDHIRLQPENSTMSPLLLREVTILGRVIGVYREIY